MTQDAPKTFYFNEKLFISFQLTSLDALIQDPLVTLTKQGQIYFLL